MWSLPHSSCSSHLVRYLGSYESPRGAYRERPMFDFLVTKIFIPAFTGIFAIGIAGCLIVIPLCAYKMFRVLFEKDTGELGVQGATRD